ncbi:phosphoglycerate kinase [mine drainage metagenome]|uniref:phosphoglycerate kinase n=1 Tax=mine drainage metagenome TaxID=410659 RepID=A0A1J5NXR2_9ZZZZ
MTFRTLDDADLSGKRALVRVDFNVPMHEGEVSDDTRLRAALPTIAKLRAGGAKVILLAHFDRPKGKVVPEMSLAPIAPALAKVLGLPVAFAADCVGPVVADAIAAMWPRLMTVCPGRNTISTPIRPTITARPRRRRTRSPRIGIARTVISKGEANRIA